VGHDHRWVVAIDGPAAAGKSTVARKVADATGSLLFDTGALYRAVTLAALRAGIAPSDGEALTALTQHSRISLQPPTVADGRQVDVLLDGEDVTWEIRTAPIDAAVSEVSAHPGVREALLDTQREIADGARVVMVGRDIGTVVTPDAGLKIYLDASPEERARRRLVDIQQTDPDATYESVLADLKRRDAYDSSRETAPLRAADDAVAYLTDGKTIDEVVADLAALVEARRREVEVAR